VQTSPHQYEYPGYPYPDYIRNRKDPPTPTGEEVKTYLHNFCVAENILNKFQFNTMISNITKNPTTGIWTLVTTIVNEQTKETKSSIESFAFVIICTGLFSNTPNIIQIPGADEFVKANGKIIHTSQWQDIEEFRNQNIIIIGNGKSAADAAIAAAKMAKLSNNTATDESIHLPNKKQIIILPPLQCIRKQNWYVPRFLLQFKFIFHSRLVSTFLPRYYEETSYTSYLLHLIFTPIKYILWRTLEVMFTFLLRLPYKVWPKFGTIDSENSLSVPLLVTDERHLSRIRNGDIDLRITNVTQLYGSKHAQLSTGEIVPVDIVVMGTGWKLDYSFFDTATVKSKLDIDVDGLWLYRNILPSNLTGLAFIGSNTLTFMNIYTSYVQAYWLVHLISGQRLPLSSEEMDHCVQREKVFKRKHYPHCPIRGASIEAYMQHYHDIIFSEQGIDPYVYTGSILAPIYNFFWPVLPETVAHSFDVVRSKTRKHTKKE
jgi:dimethylaniline monooxygenase (N-oxide forming)